MNFTEFNNELKGKPTELQKQLRQVAIKVGHAVENDSVQNFDKQGMNGKRWKKPQRVIPGTKAFKYPKSKDLSRRSRPTLIGKNAALKKAAASSYKGFTSTEKDITVHMRVDSEHGGYIQDGTPRMEARPFIGPTPQLDTKITKIIEDGINLEK